MNIPELKAKLSLDLKDWNTQVNAAKKSAEVLEKDLQNLKKVGQGFAVVGAAMSASVALIVRSFINVSEQIQDTSKALQISTKTFQELNYVASQTGTDISSISMGIKTLSRVINEAAAGGETYKQSLAQIGLTYKDLIGLSPEKQLEKVGNALNNLSSPTQRVALSLEMFGKSGTTILEATKNISALSKEAERLNIIIDRDVIEAGDALGDSFATLKQQTASLVSNIGASLAPSLLRLTKAFAEVLSKVIQFVKDNPKLVTTITITTGLIGGLSLAFGSLLTAVSLMIPALSYFGVALSAAVAPITAVVLGIAAIVAIIVYFKDIIYGLDIVFNAVFKAILLNLIQFINVAKTSLGWLPVIGEQIKDNAEKAAAAISNTIRKIDEEAIAEKKKREDEKLRIQNDRIVAELQAERKARQDMADATAKIENEEGKKRNEAIIKADMEMLAKRAEEARKATDARIAYEKSKFGQMSTDEKTRILKEEKDVIDGRLKIVKEGTQEYYTLMQQKVENQKALDDLGNVNLATGYANALAEMENKTIDYKDKVSQVFNDIQSGVAGAFETLFTDLSNGFADFGEFATSIGNAIKGALIKAFAEIVAQWVMQHVIMKAATLAWKALEISASAAVGAARAAAAAAWSLWGAIAIGAAIGAAILKMAGAFENGGLIGGNSYSGDKLLIRANSGERVLNSEQQDWLESIGSEVNNNTKSQSNISISQNINIENGNDLEGIIDTLRKGTLEALEMANLTVKLGNKQNGLAV